MIKIILRKFQTALNRYRERGFKSFLNLLRLKYLSGASFDDISNSVEDYLSEKAFMCRKSDKLGEGVRHAICFDVEGDIAEFGTYTGSTAVALATALNAAGEEFS